MRTIEQVLQLFPGTRREDWTLTEAGGWVHRDAWVENLGNIRDGAVVRSGEVRGRVIRHEPVELGEDGRRALRQQTQKHDSMLDVVTRDRNELVYALLDLVVDIHRAENAESPQAVINGESVTQYWLRDSLVQEVLRLTEGTCDAEEAQRAENRRDAIDGA